MNSCGTNSLMPFEQALSLLLQHATPPLQTETVALQDAHGRVLAESLSATHNTPPFDCSAMDGYALRLRDLEATEDHSLPVSQRIKAGDSASPLAPNSAARIFTGAPLPEGADCVVVQEACEQQGDNVAIQAQPAVDDHIRKAGCHIKSGQIVIEQGTRLQAQHIGLAASAGKAQLSVYKALTIGLVSSGDELVEPGETLKPGAIYNANQAMLKSLLNLAPCRVIDYSTLKDDLAATQTLLKQASERCDILISSGGVSVGEEDHLRQAIISLGQLELWKLAIKPGKPLAFGRIGDMAIVALPGNPVASFVTYSLFARSFILKSAGCNNVQLKPVRVRAAFERNKPGLRREFVRAQLNTGADGLTSATPYSSQDSATLLSLTSSDGLLVIPEQSTVSPGDLLDFYPYSQLTG